MDSDKKNNSSLSIFMLFVVGNRSCNQTDASGEQDEHHYCIEKTCLLKINGQVHQNSGGDNDDADKKQNPTKD